MRPDLAVQPLRLGSRQYWSVKDPISLRYYQLRDEEYSILQMLTGPATLAELKERFEYKFAPLRINLPQLQGFLGMLHREGLIVSDAPGQGKQLLQRRRRLRGQAWLARMTSVLAMRFRGFDPERLLAWLDPKVGWFFSRPAAIIGCLFGLAALVLVGVQFDALQARLPEFQAFFTVENAFWLAVAVMISKVLHEFGHALACRRFGGECHEMGVMLLVFTPCLYVNVSDAWMLPSKWQRAFIGAAGMYVEMWLAAICTFVWWYSEPGLLNAICLNLMFVCSVSTLVFNGNPLLRYDGYYILSDLIEVPNLQQQSSSLLRRILSRWLLGNESGNERVLPERRRWLLVGYAVASTAYRWFVTIAILWFLHLVFKPYGLEALAKLVAVFVIGGMVVVPAWQLVRFLSDPTRNRDVNWRRFSISLVLGTLLVATALLVPLPHRISAPVVLEPAGARRVYITVSGSLAETSEVGKSVEAGDVLARLENLDEVKEIAQLTGLRDQQRLRVENLDRRRNNDPVAEQHLPAAKESLVDLEDRLAQRIKDRARLSLKSPIAGSVLPPRGQHTPTPPGELASWKGTPLDPANLGSFLETGTLFCLVGDPDQLEAVLVIDQADVEFVRTGQTVRLALDQAPGLILTGRVADIAKIDLKVAPPELVTGGELPTLTDESGVARPISASYQARVTLDEHSQRLLLGASGWAKINVAPLSLGQRVYRYVSRTFRFDL
jgi:putative peptide zinc metalloprotease protein